MQEKLVDEFTFLKNQSVEPLNTFLDFVTCASATHPTSARALCLHPSSLRFIARSPTTSAMVT